MDAVDRMQDMIEHIDANLEQPLTLESLAARAGYSPCHFDKVFQWFIGYSPMAYVRARRLLYAAHALSSDRRILDIALDYGFETHSGFSKAFRRHFGCAPDVYRRHAHAARPTPPNLPRMGRYSIGGIVMEPKFVQRPATRIAGYAITTRNIDGQNQKDIPAFWLDYLRDGRSQALHGAAFVTEHADYGACFPEDPETGLFAYVIGLRIADGMPLPDGLVERTVPAATFAVFSTPPCDKEVFSDTIQGTWSFIFEQWFPTSGYEYAPGCVDYELYDDRCMGDSGNVCDICIPVVRKA